MQKFEILYNISFSANTALSNFGPQDSSEPVLFDTQQNVNLNQEYYSYNNVVGVSIVNDLNVKAFLDKPENEQLAINFINYLKNLLTIEEFRDLFYDNKKLAEFFNQYYLKFINFSNQGNSSLNNNPNIDIIDVKEDLFNQDELYLKTNGLTGYYTNTVSNNNLFVPNNYPNETQPYDFINFTGKTENYYINININKGNSLLELDDFREYFKDVCDGSVNYTKYQYISKSVQVPLYGNLEHILYLQTINNSIFGPPENYINYLKGLLPINFLTTTEESNNLNAQEPAVPYTTFESGIYNDNLSNQIINIPYISNNNQIQNFKGFNKFQTWFNWNYKNYSPNFFDPSEINRPYIYQSVIDLSYQINSYFTFQTSYGSFGSLNETIIAASPDAINLIPCEFEFVQDPNWNNVNFIGQPFDVNNTNFLEIKIKHTKPQRQKKVILKYETFSPGLLGVEDGINSFNLGNPNDVNQETYELDFQINEQVKSINLQIYKDWPIRLPIVLSLRPADNSLEICQYIIIYLEEFYNLSNYYTDEQINVSNYSKCNLAYNGFVYEKFNDNFLEVYRPDDIKINYANNYGFTILSGFNENFEQTVNQKLFNIFNDSSLTLAAIARRINVPESAIYNIYVNGAHYYEKNQASSDADITIVAEVQQDVTYFARGDVDFSLYNPRTFQYQLNEFAVPAFNNSSVLSDRNFFQYFTEENTFKILERISFTTNITRADFKNKAILISNSHFNDAEQFFVSRDLDKFKKRVWNAIRILIFSIQYLQYGKIIDRKAANSYLIDVEKPFLTFEEVKDYFLPILKNYKDQILSL